MSYRLNVLGTLDLRDSAGAPVNSVLQQPRRLALLVYLALVDRETMVKRDTLLGLFWPDMPQDNGRRALSQAIHFLRRSLGAEAIVARGNDDLALNHDVIECDAALFQRAVKAHDARNAAAAYAGDLLPGFFVSGVHDFEEWLSAMRDALRRTAAEVFWTAAEEARQTGQLVSAAASARRAAGLASDSETATRRLMEFLEQIGDRAGALDAYDALVRTLQTEYECAPSGKTRALAEKIRRDQTATVSEAPVVTHVERSPLSRLPWREVRQYTRTVAGAGIMMVAFLSLWGLGKRVGRTPALRTDASVAVDEVKVFDPALRDFAATMVTQVSAALVDVPGITVSAITDAPAGAGKTPHFVLKPNVSRRDGEVYVVASLVDETSKTIVRSASFTAKAGDSDALNAMAVDVSEFARKAIGRQIRETQLASLKSEDADVLSQSGLARIRADSLGGQGLAPYALLTLQHADSLVGAALAQHRSAELYVERAELARMTAWVNRGAPLFNMQSADQAMADGIRYADAAIALDAENAKAQEIRGLFAYELLFMSRGEHAAALSKEAQKYLQRATELDPTGAEAWSALSSVLIARGDYTRAYWAAERAYAADPYMDVADGVTNNLFSAALETGDLDAAHRWCADIARRAGDNWVGAYCSLRLVASKQKLASADVAQAEQLVASIKQSIVNTPFTTPINALVAVIYAKSGDAVRARMALANSTQGPLADEAQPDRAWAMAELGDRESARSTLGTYVRTNPALRAGVARSRRFVAL